MSDKCNLQISCSVGITFHANTVHDVYPSNAMLDACKKDKMGKLRKTKKSNQSLKHHPECDAQEPRQQHAVEF